VQREGVALVNPDRLLHFESACSVLRYRPMMSPAFFIFFSKAGS
jgi:hypothetical protein